MESQGVIGGILGVVTRYRSLLLVVAVIFAQLLVMAYQLRRNQDVPLVRGTVVYVVAPIQKSLAAVVHSFRNVWDGYVYLWGTRRQNQVLSDEIDQLKLENQRLRVQAEQGRRLQILFDLRQQLPLPTVAAQVLSAGPSETARIILIDKGADDGLKPDLPVLVPDGVVGKVLHVFSNTAQVLLLTDPYSGVAILLEDSRIHGVLKGENKSDCSLEYILNGEEVRSGQRVFTSGEDRIFPKGLPVGVVVNAQPGLEFQQITVRPLAQLNRLEEVLVILDLEGSIDLSATPLVSSTDAGASNDSEGNDKQTMTMPPHGPAQSSGPRSTEDGLRDSSPPSEAPVRPTPDAAPARQPLASPGEGTDQGGPAGSPAPPVPSPAEQETVFPATPSSVPPGEGQAPESQPPINAPE